MIIKINAKALKDLFDKGQNNKLTTIPADSPQWWKHQQESNKTSADPKYDFGVTRTMSVDGEILRRSRSEQSSSPRGCPPRGFALLSWSLPSITIWVWSSSGIPGKAQWRPTNIHFTDLYSIGSVLNIVSQYCKFIELEQPKLWQRNTRNSFDVWSHTLLQIRIRAVALVEVKSIHAATQAFAKHLCQVPRGCP